jgi:hypothetical protein
MTEKSLITMPQTFRLQESMLIAESQQCNHKHSKTKHDRGNLINKSKADITQTNGQDTDVCIY